MNLLIIGNGGREHALAWKASQSPLVNKIYVAPGNAGTALEPRVENVAIRVDDIEQLVVFATQHDIALTLVGPELPLSLGVVDQFEAAGLACLGPSQAAAQLESSKIFSKNFMVRHRIPTARHCTFAETHKALAYLAQQSYPLVIKADGLAAGKGVIIAESNLQAQQAITQLTAQGLFGGKDQQIMIEDFIQGEEASFIVLCDGNTVLPLASSQDHKACYNGDKGPNTGGMGAYSPAPRITPALQEDIMQHVIKPTIAGMKKEGLPYQGFLYAGLMIDGNNQIYVLEFNCRLGDPETQVILPRPKK